MGLYLLTQHQPCVETFLWLRMQFQAEHSGDKRRIMKQKSPGLLLLYPWKSSSTGGAWHAVVSFQEQKYPYYFTASVSSDRPGFKCSWLQICETLHTAWKQAACCKPNQLQRDLQVCLDHGNCKGLAVHKTHNTSDFALSKTPRWYHRCKQWALSMVLPRPG